jgi:hypothetical protein
MKLVTRLSLLGALSKHGTLTIEDLANPEYVGLQPNPGQLTYLLRQLVIGGHIILLSGVKSATYTITKNGIEENNRLLNGH